MPSAMTATANGQPPSANGANGQTGRDAHGHFTKGNRGGPGNPFARQIAGFRRALCNAVTERDIADLAAVLVFQAKTGNLAAMKLLLQYVIGRPAEPANPDTLDANELQTFQKNSARDEAMELLDARAASADPEPPAGPMTNGPTGPAAPMTNGPTEPAPMTNGPTGPAAPMRNGETETAVPILSVPDPVPLPVPASG